MIEIKCLSNIATPSINLSSLSVRWEGGGIISDSERRTTLITLSIAAPIGPWDL